MKAQKKPNEQKKLASEKKAGAKRGRPPKDPVPAAQLLKMKDWKRASPEKASVAHVSVNVFF